MEILFLLFCSLLGWWMVAHLLHCDDWQWKALQTHFTIFCVHTALHVQPTPRAHHSQNANLVKNTILPRKIVFYMPCISNLYLHRIHFQQYWIYYVGSLTFFVRVVHLAATWTFSIFIKSLLHWAVVVTCIVIKMMQCCTQSALSQSSRLKSSHRTARTTSFTNPQQRPSVEHKMRTNKI